MNSGERLIVGLIAFMFLASVAMVFVTLRSQPIEPVKCVAPDGHTRIPCEED